MYLLLGRIIPIGWKMRNQRVVFSCIAPGKYIIKDVE